MHKLIMFAIAIFISNAAYADQFKKADITQAQKLSIQKALVVKSKNRPLLTAISEARENIAGFLEIESCISNYNGSPLNAYAAPGTNFRDYSYTFIMRNMSNHLRTSCVTVTKTQGWSMPAKNAIWFEVVFSSDSSGEVYKQYYKLQKQEDGAWLFK